MIGYIRYHLIHIHQYLFHISDENIEFITEYYELNISKIIQNIMSDTKKRTFKIKFNGEESGRIRGSTPRSAAAKALSSIKKNNPNYKAGSENEFSIIESTRGSKHKEFKYTGKVVDLDTPHEVNVGNKTITYKHKCTITRINNKKKSDGKN